jgi:hypothetical protein
MRGPPQTYCRGIGAAGVPVVTVAADEVCFVTSVVLKQWRATFVNVAAAYRYHYRERLERFAAFCGGLATFCA